MANALKKYFVEMAKFPLLTGEQELELGFAIREGDMAAREQLINCNLRLVVYIAKSYRNTTMPFEDLIAEGMSGLITAVDKFNPDLGYRFSTCATPWIKQAITKAITDKGKTIRIPAHVYQQLNKMNKAIAELEAEGHRNPSDKEIGDRLGLTAEKVATLKTWNQTVISLETPVGHEEDTTIGDLQPDLHMEGPMEYVEKSFLMKQVQAMLSTLPVRTQIIMKMRYGVGGPNDPADWRKEHTLEEVGAYLKITRERVRQIEKEALLKLKNEFSNKF